MAGQGAGWAGDNPGMLTSLGLAPAEQDLYQHLVRRPPASLAELTASHGGTVRSTVDRLVALGLLVRLAGPPERVAVVSPRAVLEPLYLARACQLAEARGRMLALATRANDEAARRESGPPVELLRGAEALVAAAERIKCSVKEVIRFWDAPPYLRDPTVATPGDEAVVAARCTVRVVYHPRAVSIPGRPADMVQEAARDVHARVADVPMKLSIADQSLALVLQVVDDRAEGLLVREPVLIAALTALFELYWDRGVPLGTYAEQWWSTDRTGTGPTSPAPPDGEDRELLVLLGAGLTDREIGETLGRHERTIRERIQVVKARLGAQTRYQAGYLAARYGWISPAQRAAASGGVSGVR